jgi:shikimate dehydrogenase
LDRYAIIGNPVAHSKSPLIQEAFARATGQRLRYERLLAPLDGFAATVQTFVEANGLGLNVTIPFKLQAFALARERSARAQSARACNTLAWRGDHWFGDNTDGAGVVRDLTRNLGETIAGRNVLVLGAGGAARGIAGA